MVSSINLTLLTKDIFLYSKQTYANLHLSYNHSKFVIFLHDKGHLFLPRPDRIFGSEYYLLQMSELAKEMDNSTEYHQYFEMERSYWKSLDSEEKRCDVENRNNATKCVTHFLENSVGCSMGISESDNELERYPRNTGLH